MPNLTAAIDAFDQALLVSAKARTKIAVIYLQSARDLYQDRDARRRYSRAIWLYLDKATTYDSNLKRNVSTWAMTTASNVTRAERTTESISLPETAAKIDPESHGNIARCALKYPNITPKKGFFWRVERTRC